MFDDLLDANRRYREGAHDASVPAGTAKDLAVLTCMDSRLDPLAMLGLAPGDAHVFRNAGARVTVDALRSLILAVDVLGVTRVCVVQHTDCAVAKNSEELIHEAVAEASGADSVDWDFLAIGDQAATVREDLDLLRTCELLPGDLVVAGFLFDIETGELVEVSG